MAKAKTTKDEIVKNENVAGAEAAEPAENSASESETTTDAKDETVAKASASAKDCTCEEKLVTVVMPRYLFTTDPNETHHVVGNQGKNWLIKYDEPMEVPEVIANIVNDAIAQKKKVNELINSLNGKAREFGEE